MSLTRFIKSVVKVKMESIFAIAAALLVLFTAMMNSYISVGIAVTFQMQRNEVSNEIW